EPELGLELGLQGEGPRRMHAHAERREDADPPIAELVAEPLDRDPPIGRQRARVRLLLAEVREEVLGGESIEPIFAFEQRLRPVARQRVEFAYERPDRPAELRRPPRPVAAPERQPSALARRRRDEHAVLRDLLHTPRRGP